MKLRFLGTGGGRYATGEQIRKTGGIVLETDETQLHIDPGPGALVESHRQLKNPLETEAVIVSHGHLDHQNDAEAITEMMTESAGKPGAVFANETVLEGHGDLEKSISEYHKKLCRTVRKLDEDTRYEFRDITIESQEMFHGDPKTAGFVIEGDKSVGFWTDTEFSEELLELYEGVDWLVVYCTRKRNSSVPQHTSIDDVPDIVESVKPKTVIITHYGKKFLDSDMEAEEEWLEKQIESKLVFAEDGMVFPGNRSLGDF